MKASLRLKSAAYVCFLASRCKSRRICSCKCEISAPCSLGALHEKPAQVGSSQPYSLCSEILSTDFLFTKLQKDAIEQWFSASAAY